MAINDYATLQAAVADWLARADLSARIPDFIALAEARMNRELRVAPMLAQVAGTSVGTQIELPADCRQVFTLRINTGGVWRELPALPPNALAETAVGLPRGYVLISNVLQLIGGEDAEYRLAYWQGIAPLSQGPNWLITSHPDAYLYGALVQSAPFLKDDERLVTWGTIYKGVVDQIALESERARWGNAPAVRFGGP